MRYIFVNVIADGPVDWKHSLTARGQPGIADFFMIAVQNGDVIRELGGTDSRILQTCSDLAGGGFVIVGHSVEYHWGHLRAEMISRGTDPCDGRVQTICTMLSLTGHVPKFNVRKGWPTFAECCHHLGIERANPQTAKDNARNLARVFEWMKKIGAVPEPKIWKERNHG